MVADANIAGRQAFAGPSRLHRKPKLHRRIDPQEAMTTWRISFDSACYIGRVGESPTLCDGAAKWIGSSRQAAELPVQSARRVEGDPMDDMRLGGRCGSAWAVGA
jgi:hypothetical protein